MSDFNPQQVYLAYLQQQVPKLDRKIFASLEKSLATCNWEDPQSAWEWNNLAVAALVEAERSTNELTKGLYIEMAFNALQTGNSLGDYPLCSAHLALLYALLGDYDTAAEISFDRLINTFQPAYTEDVVLPGIVYLPPIGEAAAHAEYFSHTINAENGHVQTLYLLAEALWRTQLLTDQPQALRILHLAGQLLPHSFITNLRLGIYSLGMQELEGLLYLHRAQEIVPDSAAVLQALYLAYRDLGQTATSDYWLEIAQDYGNQRSNVRTWQWITAVQETGFTYTVLKPDCLLAIEPSLQSLTTRALIAEGDWYEREMEFWSHQIQPGMTVIDVGANVGVYTFSAAQRVGAQGRVIAIEPSSFHVACLKETIRLNSLDWVEVFAGAASNSLGKIILYLQSPSEFHQVLGTEVEQIEWDGETEEVICFQLDTFVAQSNVAAVDFLKISTVGHELAVLQGCEKTLANFRPKILYHNLFNNEPNLEVAAFLTERNYQLFKYRPYMQELLPIGTADDLVNVVKVVAIPLSSIGSEESSN